MTSRTGTWADAFSLGIGTFTLIPVRAPRTVDKRTASRALLLSVVIGALIGAAMWAVIVVFTIGWDSAFISALAAITFSSAITRGLHLDGLADTADGLGSRRTNQDGVAVMRRSDIGPFGVATLLLVLLVQVSCLAILTSEGLAWMLVLIQAAGRAAAVLACQRSIPPASPAGIGAGLTQSTSPIAWFATAIGLTVIAAATALLPGVTTADALRLALALVVGWLAAYVLLRSAVRRFGGITGDIIGAAVEVTITVALVVAAAVAF